MHKSDLNRGADKAKVASWFPRSRERMWDPARDLGKHCKPGHRSEEALSRLRLWSLGVSDESGICESGPNDNPEPGRQPVGDRECR
jgi:hypothetical protein